MPLWGEGWLEVVLAKPPPGGIVGFQVGRPMRWIHRFQLNAVFVEIGFDPGFHVLQLPCWGRCLPLRRQCRQRYSPAELEYLDKLWQRNSETLLQCERGRKPDCKMKLQ
jgi:hypothetical protein